MSNQAKEWYRKKQENLKEEKQRILKVSKRIEELFCENNLTIRQAKLAIKKVEQSLEDVVIR